eukprot:CAMPEP_0177552542 /NCGR_PEP_ID=MMETSP0369-20130122/66892_1 /TAXON_ID=447022 ORGANISM="Scrippsiella hangoei-like, Strain SHHI-4" /NCGR_SAMPLE_ID=MMETSP0369 /ASSEMBLY_ACC=CAM_ASM_000364 /LENGTH=87 /DNA_ID=CAMNT_0019038279 /DNA_START=63 /DNA_END=327 /DNA_ORIENTATION=-
MKCMYFVGADSVMPWSDGRGTLREEALGSANQPISCDEAVPQLYLPAGDVGYECASSAYPATSPGIEIQRRTSCPDAWMSRSATSEG